MLGFPALSGAPPRREQASAVPPLQDLEEGTTGCGRSFLWKPVPHPRPSASARQPAGHSGTPRHPDSARSVRGQRAPRGHRPPRARALRAGPRGLHPSPGPEQRPPRLTSVPGGGRGPRSPPRLAARRVTHILAAAVAAAATSRGSADSCGERPRR